MSGATSGVETRTNVALRVAGDEVQVAGGPPPGGGTALDRLMASGGALARFRGDAGIHVVVKGEPLAYRHWLSDYVDHRVDVARFMNDPAGVEASAMRELYR